MRTISIKYHSNQVLATPLKPPDLVMDIYGSQTYELKTRVDIWKIMDVVTLEYGTYAHQFCLKVWFL